MRKLKFPALTFIFSIIFMAVGYANWGETNELGSSVKTGELDLRYENKEVDDTFKCSEYVETNVEIVDENGHEAKVTLSNLYPGAWAMFKLQVVNSGTIPAKLENAEMDFEGDTFLLQYLNYKAGISVDKDGDSIIDWKSRFEGLLSNFENDLNDEVQNLGGAYLESNNLGKLNLGIPTNSLDETEIGIEQNDYILIKFDENAPQNTQDKSLAFNLRLNFKQYSY
jgi:hypothetical protein